MKNAKGYTRTELNAIITKYLMEAISTEGYDEQPTTDKDRVNFVFDQFNKTHNYAANIKRFPNLQDRFADWLQGLPSVFNIDYANYRIIEIAIEWGALTDSASEKQQVKILNNWWGYIANKFLILHNKVNR